MIIPTSGKLHPRRLTPKPYDDGEVKPPTPKELEELRQRTRKASELLALLIDAEPDTRNAPA